MPKRERLARGIYRDAWGISVIYRADGKPLETRFPSGASIDRLLRWRARQIAQQREIRPGGHRQTLTRDVVRYLKRLKGLPGYKSEKSHLRAWLALFGDRPRRSITEEQVDLALARWRVEGYSARTIRHRCRVLVSLYRRLDGAHAITPLDDIKRPAKPKPRPVSVPDDVISAVALELVKHEIAGTLRDSKTRARFLVMATTGRRPIEVQRAERGDVDFTHRVWWTRTAKGGVNNELILNDEQLEAWRLFAAADAWGAYDSRSLTRTVQRCGWPKGIDVYNLRHSTAKAIRRRGGDAGDIQDQLGHASITTAREFYFGENEPARKAAVGASLEGRLDHSAFLPRKLSHDRAGEPAKVRDNAGKNARPQQPRRAAFASTNRKKSA